MDEIPIDVKLSKEQIKIFVSKLDTRFLISEFLIIDGIPVTLELVKMKSLQYGIQIYICREICGYWYSVENKFDKIISKV